MSLTAVHNGKSIKQTYACHYYTLQVLDNIMECAIYTIAGSQLRSPAKMKSYTTTIALLVIKTPFRDNFWLDSITVKTQYIFCAVNKI